MSPSNEAMHEARKTGIRAVSRALERVWASARELAESMSAAGRVATQLQQLDESACAAWTAVRSAVAAVTPILVGGIAAAEMLLSRPVAAWFAFRVVGERELLTTVAWALPMAIFAVNLLFALAIDDRSRRAEDGEQVSATPVIALAGLELFTLCSFSLASQLQVAPSADSPLMTMFWVRTGGLIGLSLVLHGAILGSGSYLRDSLEFYFHLGPRLYFAAVQWNRTRRVKQAKAGVVSALGAYVRLHREHSARWPPEEFGPFPDNIHDLVPFRPPAPGGGHVEADPPRTVSATNLAASAPMNGSVGLPN